MLLSLSSDGELVKWENQIYFIQSRRDSSLLFFCSCVLLLQEVNESVAKNEAAPATKYKLQGSRSKKEEGKGSRKIYAKKPFLLDMLQIVKDLWTRATLLPPVAGFSLMLFGMTRFYQRATVHCRGHFSVCFIFEYETRTRFIVIQFSFFQGFSFQLWGFSMFVFNFYVILCEKVNSSRWNEVAYHLEWSLL